MAASNTEESNSDKKTRGCGSEVEFELDDDEGVACGAECSSAATNKPDSVSMFCKNCLNPYSGAQKSGTFVLKCKVCGLTDTVLQEEASELNPERYSGNLMMNRFLQVIRDQEDMNVNIGDPEFADDMYKDLNTAISDFCIYMNAIAKRLLEVTKAEKRKPNQNVSQNEMDRGTEDGCERENEGDSPLTDIEGGTPLADGALLEIKTLRSSVLKVIAVLIRKYNLPADIWVNIEQKLRNPGATAEEDNHSDDDVDVKEIADILHSPEEKQSSGRQKRDAAIETEKEELLKGKEDKENSSQNKTLKSEKEIHKDRNTDERKTICGIDIGEVRSTLDEEVLGKLGSKFNFYDRDRANEVTNQTDSCSLKTGDNGVSESEPVDSSGDDLKKKSEDDVLDKEILQKLGSKFKFHHAYPTELDVVLLSLMQNTKCVKDMWTGKHEASEVKKGKEDSETSTCQNETESKPKKLSDMHEENLNSNKDEEDEETGDLEVSFQAVASAFLNELQRRKRDALLQRKQKAITMVGAKLIAIKQQVMMVERQIRMELNKAYENKLKKAKNQKQALAEKQQKIETVEDLLNHYIATGQMDKVGELMRKFHSANQNN